MPPPLSFKGNCPVVNGPILSQLFQVEGNHQIWQKDAFKGKEIKLIGNNAKVIL